MKSYSLNIFLMVIFIGSCFEIEQEAPEQKLRLVNAQGNITAEMKQYIKSLINNSTQIYRRYQLNDMSRYIGQNLNKNYGQTWQIFIYGQGTQNCNINASTIYANWWLKWQLAGIYDLCYVMYNTHKCQNPKSIGILEGQNYQEDWGASWTEDEKDRVKALIDQAVIYGGNSMGLNAQYINARLGSGGWAVSIGGPSNGIGIYTCYFRSYYAILVDFTDFLWTYVFIRQF